MSKRMCLDGHVTKNDKALKCAMCGLDLPPAPKRRHKALAFALIVLFAFSALVLCGAIQSIVKRIPSESEPQATTTAVIGKPTRTPSPTPTSKPVSALVYGEIKQQFEILTDAQFEAYAKPLVGQVIRWSGWVEDVTTANGRGVLDIDMDSPDAILSVREFAVTIPSDAVLTYNKDARITFQGELKKISKGLFGSLQIEVEKVTVE